MYNYFLNKKNQTADLLQNIGLHTFISRRIFVSTKTNRRQLKAVA
jgi:DNA-directed RNA polymerase subunit N (RpoN/RPB10)